MNLRALIPGVLDEPIERVRLISDEHYGHERIIELVGRPFGSIAEMDDAIIDACNEGADDGTVTIHLGDFAFRSATTEAAFRRLRGRHLLVVGNHDLVRPIRSARYGDWAGSSEPDSVAEPFYSCVPEQEHVPSEKGLALYRSLGVRVIRSASVLFLGHRATVLAHHPRPERLEPVDEGGRPFAPRIPANIPLLHGHTHSADPGDRLNVNLCVEARGYRPVPAAEALEQIRG